MFPQPLMLLGPDAIGAIRIECNTCKSSVSLHLRNARESGPTTCPGCGDLWTAGAPGAGELIQSLSLALRTWAAAETLKFPFAVRLEISPSMHRPPEPPKRG